MKIEIKKLISIKYPESTKVVTYNIMLIKNNLDIIAILTNLTKDDMDDIRQAFLEFE